MLPSLLRQFYFIFKAQEDKSKKRFPFPASPLLPSSTLAVRYFKPDWFPQSCCCLLPPPVFTASIFSSLFFDARIILTGGDVSTVCSSRTEVSLQPISSNIASHSRQQTTTWWEEWGVRTLRVMELAGQHLVLTPSCLASGQWGTPAQPLSDSSLTQPGEYHVLHCMTSHAGPPQSRSLFNEAKTE